MSHSLAAAAIEKNQVVHIIYAAGSYPGKVRPILPTKLSKGKIYAICKLRDEEREFELEKVTFLEPDEVKNYEYAELPLRVGTIETLINLVSPLIPESTKIVTENQNICIKQAGEAIVSIEFRELNEDGFKRERPWQIGGKCCKPSHFTSFDGAANKFYTIIKSEFSFSTDYYYELQFLESLKKQYKARAIAKPALIAPIVANIKGGITIKTAHWKYKVCYGHREALGMSYVKRMKNKKSYMTWVQGICLSFKEGDVFEHSFLSELIQVMYAVPSGWDMDEGKMYQGVVTFDTFKKIDGKIKKQKSYSTNQMAFLKILITGNNELTPLNGGQ
ncbi:hypothetical protein ACSLBF_08100 [Pseudoalteromonas sp. T1lg65]|uniref:hypothetical protein n=1 Tax=Pseudoalteromonas sp. T1lg65 TaxID=2077101 RepID=UPI003F79BD88